MASDPSEHAHFTPGVRAPEKRARLARRLSLVALAALFVALASTQVRLFPTARAAVRPVSQQRESGIVVFEEGRPSFVIPGNEVDPDEYCYVEIIYGTSNDALPFCILRLNPSAESPPRASTLEGALPAVKATAREWLTKRDPYFATLSNEQVIVESPWISK